MFVCGGGAHNATLMQSLAAKLPDVSVGATSGVGLHPDWVEATAFAWLAARRLARQSGSIASVTGADRDTVLGGIYTPGKA